MKRIKSIDLIAFSYCLYFSITLGIEQNMFDRESELYGYFKMLNESEMAWGITAFSISVTYFISFIVKNQKWISITSSVMSGIFFIVVGSAYMITYPNIGSGIFTIIGVVCFMNIGRIAIPKENLKKEVEENHENANAD